MSKFYQLRAMDFLVREVNLEYEVQRKKEKLMQQANKEFTVQWKRQNSSEDITSMESFTPKYPKKNDLSLPIPSLKLDLDSPKEVNNHNIIVLHFSRSV
jgi:hypothetical protein